MGRFFTLTVLLSVAASAAIGGEVGSSTGTAVAVSSASTRRPAASDPVFGGPIRFQLRYDDRRRTTAEVTYLLRWDLEDVKRLPRSVGRLAMNPFGTTERAVREMFDNADVGFYSMRFRLGKYLPLDRLLSPLSYASDKVERGYSSMRKSSSFDIPQSEAPDPQTRERKRRRKLDFTPVVDNIERDIVREMRRGIITTGFNLALPAARGAPFGQKEAVVESLREAGEIWEDKLDRELKKGIKKD